jgi:hypothetical protein
MNCLINHIGVLGCGTEPSYSNSYINQLPSINVDVMASIADAEQETFINVFKDIEKRAIDRLSITVNSLFSKRYKLKTFTGYFDLQKLKFDLLNTILPSTSYKGFKFKLQDLNAYNKSNFQSIYIDKVGVYLKSITANPFDIFVVDSITGDVLFTKTISVSEQVIGYNTFNCNLKTTSYQINILVDSTEIESVTTSELNELNGGFCGCSDYLFNGCTGYFTGVQTTDLSSKTNVSEINNTFGVYAAFKVGCNYESIICANKDSFTYPLLYLMGAELMIERIFSNRINRYTTTDIQQAKELRDYFLSEYDKSIEVVIAGININTNDCCIECNGTYQYKEALL